MTRSGPRSASEPCILTNSRLTPACSGLATLAAGLDIVSGLCRRFFASVQRDRALAKFWLEPVALAQSANFPAHELGIVRGLVVENRGKLITAWHEYFAR